MKYVNIPYYYVREYTLCTPRSSGCDSQQSIPIPHSPKPARPTRLSCYRADRLTLYYGGLRVVAGQIVFIVITII